MGEKKSFGMAETDFRTKSEKKEKKIEVSPVDVCRQEKSSHLRDLEKLCKAKVANFPKLLSGIKETILYVLMQSAFYMKFPKKLFVF